jgi:hypothetical protein
MAHIPSIGIGALLLACAACASTPLPTEQLAVADSAIERAETAGAAEFAAAELATARDKLQRARAGAEDRSLPAEEIAHLAEQAEADAKLATATAQAGRMRAAVAETEATLRALQEEAERAAEINASTLP